MDGSQTIVAEIVSVSSRTVNRKDGSGSFLMYDVQVREGGNQTPVYSTTFKEPAEDAYALVGQMARLSVKVEQNGQWTNRYLQKVLGHVAPGAELPDALVPENTSSIPSADPVVPPSQVQQPVIPDRSAELADKEDLRQERIARSTALKVAAVLAAPGDSEVDFWNNVDVALAFIERAVKPVRVTLAQQQ